MPSVVLEAPNLIPAVKIVALLAVCLSLAATVAPPAAPPRRPLPYPQSQVIAGLDWTGAPSRYPGTGSDMHWYTWGHDDALYVIDDDGANFGGPANYAHLLRITGVPPHHRVETVTDFTDYDFRSQIPTDRLVRRYVNGVLAVDSTLYVCLYDYDWEIEGKIYDRADLSRRIREFNPWHDLDSTVGTNMGFIDAFSKNGGIAALIRSTDGGRTWDNLPTPTTPQFLGPRFAGMSFLTWGPGYTRTPPELAGYVYGISNDGNWESGDHVFAARAPRNDVLNRARWEFFGGFGPKNRPRWVKREADAQPIFSDPGHVGHPTMSYNPALKRYFLMIYSDVVPHRENAPPAERKQWDFASELQVYESPTPFGPWALVHDEAPWGGSDHSSYLGQMPAKWLSADGRSGTVMFAGDYVNRRGEYYGLMTQPFRLRLR